MSKFTKIANEILNDTHPTDTPIPSDNKSCPTAPPKEAFNPERTFYDSSNGKYITDVGTHYREYGRKKALMSGIRRYMDYNHINEDIESIMENIELDRAIDWQGSIAGYKRGLHTFHGKSYLVKDEPNIVDSIEGKFPLIDNIIDQAFPTSDERCIFLSWLSDGVKAIKACLLYTSPSPRDRG